MPVRAPVEAFFLPPGEGAEGELFAIHHPPQGTPLRALVVYVHPFAEEMNKSRRMAALQARQLASRGLAVLSVDLFGCGDSAGDSAQATWARWIEDVVQAVHWMQLRHGSSGVPVWLWGLRAGALVATAAGARLAVQGLAVNFLFWQPATAGKVVLQQFLRLRNAGEMLAGQAVGGTAALRYQISQGKPVEVAGYELTEPLCEGLERATLAPPLGAGRLEWLELAPRENIAMGPASAATLRAWQQAGWAVRTRQVQGPSFWQTTEIEDAPALLDATTAALLTHGAST